MSVEPDAVSGQSPRRRNALRPRAFPDALYGEVRLSGWIAPLLDTPPFRRLAGVSLSDVPGEILFRHPFPSRLDHSRGVYFVARMARPRDRALHVAALAHDLGHGPFSHLTEPFMVEQLGVDHEQRSAELLAQVRAALTPSAARQIAWLDWDEVAALMLGETNDSRGTLLNGLMDYDNLDNIARFLVASGLAQPGYDPRQLARALRPGGQSAARVMVMPDGAEAAQAWLADRATVYAFLHEGHRNLASHAMLQKAVALAAAAETLPRGFFDMTDSAALAFLSRRPQSPQAELVQSILRDDLYTCIWEAEIPREAEETVDLLGRWRDRLDLEVTLAAEAGLAPDEVVCDALTSSAHRELPPLLTADGPLAQAQSPEEQPCVFHLFVVSSAGRDYQRRLRMAAERRLSAMGAVPLHRVAHE
jgi:uncharacterized protein